MNKETLTVKAEALQKEMHRTIELMMGANRKLSYQDCVNVFLLTKLAEFGEALKGEADTLRDAWISVSERLPEIGTPVLLHTEFMRDGKPAFEIFTGLRDEYGECLKYPDEDSYGWQFDECVTFWQPLPPAPQNKQP